MSKKNKGIAVYPGSFDPMTLGHLDVIERASQLFDRLVIGVGHNPAKSGFIPIEKRVALIERIVAKFKNVSVEEFSDLTVAFAKRKNAGIILRGLRTESDFGLEMQMATMNRTLDKNLESVFIPTKPEYAHISSTLAREIYQFKGDIKDLVPKEVVAYFSQKSK